MTSPADISDVMRQEGSDQEQEARRLKKYPSLYGDEPVTPARQDGEGCASQATRKPKGNGMIFELTWNGPVGDVYYRVEADTWEDAEQEVCRALNEDDERWLRAHEIQPVWSEADEHDEG